MKKGAVGATVTALMVTLLLTTAASAQPNMGERAGGGGWGGRSEMAGGPAELPELGGFMRLLGALDLTEEQRHQIRTIMEDTRDDVRDAMERNELTDRRGRMLELFASQNLTESEVLSVMEERDAVRDEVRGIVAAAVVDVHDVLTAEQLSRLAELIEQGPPEGGPQMGGHRGPGGGGFRR